MKNIVILLSTIFFLSCSDYVLQDIETESSEDSSVIHFSSLDISVYDGDTFTIYKDSSKIKVRLYGIDAPEHNQFYGDSSTIALENFLEGDSLWVKVIDIDKYGRSVCKVYNRDLYINNEMVATGNAWWYKYYAKNDSDLSTSFTNAQNNKRGLWNYPNPQNPADYRKEH